MSFDKWDIRFLEMAKVISGWSKDPSTQVGSILVAPDRHIISTGFNGFPRKMQDSVDLYSTREEKYSRIIHGEMNALIHAKESLEGATLYTWPFASCDRCAVHLLQAGVVRFVAPKLPPELEERWGAALEKTRGYIQECGAELVELDFR